MRKNTLKRVLCAALAVTMLCLLLTGCGNGGESSGDGYVYVPSYLSLPKEITEINSPTIADDTIYFSQTKYYDESGKEVNTDDYYSYLNLTHSDASVASGTDITTREDTSGKSITPKVIICSVKTDGTGYSEYPDYKSPEVNGEDSYGRVSSLFVDQAGGLWVLESISTVTYDFPEGISKNSENYRDYASQEEKYNLCKLSETGSKTTEIDLSSVIDKPEVESYLYINLVVFDKDGNIFFTDGSNSVYVLDPSGALLFKLTEENGLNAVLKLKDNSVAAAVYDNDYKVSLKVINIASKSWGEEKSIPNDAHEFVSGGSVYDFCYKSGTSLFGYDCSTDTETKILTWINCDIDGDNLMYSTIKENGDVLAIGADWNKYGSEGGSENGTKYEIITLEKTPANKVEKKTALTFATMYLDYNIRSQIIKFNKENPDYRIDIIDYSEFNTDEDYEAGATKLNTEIISGNVPDIININQLPYQQYAAKGLLEDLYTYIDSDSDISREDFVQSILKATESGGKLYTLSPTFNVVSIIGASSVVGDDMGWTLDDMQKIIKEHPGADMPFGAYMTRDNVLQFLCMLNLDSFMDWNTGKCSFDSEQFKNLLKFAGSFPESAELPENGDDYLSETTLIADGRQLFTFYSSSNFTDYQMYKALYGGSITYKGMPKEEGVGNVASVEGGIAMTTSCKYKEGAWQFMKMLLDEDYQKSMWGYPILQSSFDKKLADAMELYQKDTDGNYILDDNGEKIPASSGGMSSDDFSIEFGPVSQEDADQLKAMINSVEHTTSNDTELMKIITDETAAFFAGEKSLDETASIIQSRMNIYINEQR